MVCDSEAEFPNLHNCSQTLQEATCFSVYFVARNGLQVGKNLCSSVIMPMGTGFLHDMDDVEHVLQAQYISPRVTLREMQRKG